MSGPRLSVEDERELGREAVELCRELIRVDTTNPPGHESRAAEVLCRYLTERGVAVDTVESSPGRTSVVGRLPGRDPDAAPGLLLSHLDTSPVQTDFWTFDPFVGDVQDGYVRGRGAVDIKSLLAVHAVALAWLARRGIVPDHDLVLLSVADETRGGAAGIRWMEENRPDLLEAQWVLGEGSFSYSGLLGADRTVFTFCPEEKTALWLEIEARGPGGHSSIPRQGTAVERLVSALTRVVQAAEPGYGATTESFLDGIGELLGLADRSTTVARLSEVPAFSAMLTDTVNPTVVSAGFEPSVVPAVAKATLDCRLRPETDPDAFISRVRELIDDPNVTVTERFRAVSGTSSSTGDVPQRLRSTVARVIPDAVVVPIVSAGYTDLRVFRSRGVPAYGCHVVPLTLEDRSRISGHDERIPAASVELGARVVHEFLAGG